MFTNVWYIIYFDFHDDTLIELTIACLLSYHDIYFIQGYIEWKGKSHFQEINSCLVNSALDSLENIVYGAIYSSTCKLKPETHLERNFKRNAKMLLAPFLNHYDEEEAENWRNFLWHKRIKRQSSICENDQLIREFTRTLFDKIGSEKEQRKIDWLIDGVLRPSSNISAMFGRWTWNGW